MFLWQKCSAFLITKSSFEIDLSTICQQVQPGKLQVNCTPLVRQYGILSNKWGAVYVRYTFNMPNTFPISESPSQQSSESSLHEASSPRRRRSKYMRSSRDSMEKNNMCKKHYVKHGNHTNSCDGVNHYGYRRPKNTEKAHHTARYGG